MKRNNKRWFSLFLTAGLLTASLAGCGGQASKPDAESSAETEAAEADAASGTDITKILTALKTTEKDLDIEGKYTVLSDIADGQTDPDLVGTWITADGSTSYIYNEDGTASAASEYGESGPIPYTCLSIGDYKVVCEEMPSYSYTDDGEAEETTALSYSTYLVQNDALYMVSVEAVNEDANSYVASLLQFYKADESGSAEASIAENPVSLAALNGKWVSDKGAFTIEGDSLTIDGADALPVTFNARNELCVGPEDTQNAYNYAIGVMKYYGEDGAADTESIVLSLSYEGADEADRPNLADLMEDWHADYGYDQYRFAASFERR